MAEEKTSFILYTDLHHTVTKMPDDKAGVLFKTILEYVSDLNPKVEDLLVDLVFEPIKQQLKRDLKNYEHIKEERSRNGRIGNLKKWHSDLYDLVIGNKIELEVAESIAKSRKVSPPDNEGVGAIKNIANIADNDNVNDTVNDNDIYNTLMSEIEISDERLSSKEKEWFTIAKSFIEVFKLNKKSLGDENMKHLESAKYKPYVDPIRLLMESDKYKKEDIQIVYKFLKGKDSSFWKKNILSTVKLREKFTALLIDAKNPKQQNNGYGKQQVEMAYEPVTNRIDHSNRDDD